MPNTKKITQEDKIHIFEALKRLLEIYAECLPHDYYRDDEVLQLDDLFKKYID